MSELNLPPRRKPREELQDLTPYATKPAAPPVAPKLTQPPPAVEPDTPQTGASEPDSGVGREGQAFQVRKPASELKNVRFGFLMSQVEMDSAKNTWFAVRQVEGQPRFSQFVREAVASYVQEMERKHNDGQPFPNVGDVPFPAGSPGSKHP